MRKKRLFYYYQPNNKECGDCQIRALSKAWDCSWIEAFDRTVPICRKYQLSGVFDGNAKYSKEPLDELGFKYTGISNKKGSKRPTIYSFTKDHPEGTYIVVVAHHVVCVKNGLYWDIWDSGECSLYGYYEKVVD